MAILKCLNFNLKELDMNIQNERVIAASILCIGFTIALIIIVYAVLATDDCVVTTTTTQESGSTITVEEKVCE